MSRRFTLETEDGLRLEAERDAPDDPRASVVLCHPHPDMGGTMSAPLLIALRDEFVQRGWAVVRFNFRGVGRSEGTASLGEKEVRDARAAIASARTELPRAPLGIVGWSFGGAVAVRAAAEDDTLVGCVAIAPSVQPRPGVSAGLPRADELDLGVPLLIVCGSNDEVTPPEATRDWLRPVEHAEFIEMRAANHFFWGRYEQLGSIATAWLERRARL